MPIFLRFNWAILNFSYKFFKLFVICKKVSKLVVIYAASLGGLCSSRELSTLDGLWNSFVSDAELFMYPNQMHKLFISICKHFEQNEYFSRFELCSDVIKIGVWIYSAGLNHWVGLNCLGVAQIKYSGSLVLIQSCNGHAIRANVNKPSKQAKRRECRTRAVSQHSIYVRYIRPTDNARQINFQ